MIVIGVDLSPASAGVLRWAFERARLPKEPAFVLHVGPPTSDLVRHTPLVETRRADELRRLRELVARAGPGDGVTVDVVDGHPSEVLPAESALARLLVIGSRGMAGIHAVLAGSVSHDVLRHTRCPVVVVPPLAPATEDRGRVVVGVDDSPNSTAALRWAAEEAGRLDLPLVLVHAIASPGPEDVIAMVPSPSDEPAAWVVVEDASVLVRREARGPVTIAPYVSREPAGRALIRFSRPGDLLVVGTHARGPLARAFLGSTSAYCVEHAPCPVAVIPLH